MADIKLWGATFPDVPKVLLPTATDGQAEFYEVAGSQTITENGTYDVTALAEAIVNVAGGGGGYELIYSDNLVVNTTSTSASLIKEISVPDAIGKNVLYIRVRDTEGARTNHYYGLDSIYIFSD